MSDEDSSTVTLRLETHGGQEIAVAVFEGAGYVELFSIEGQLLPVDATRKKASTQA
jgi:hypothetical protein